MTNLELGPRFAGICSPTRGDHIKNTHLMYVECDCFCRIILRVPHFVVRLDVRLEKLWDVDDDGDDDDRNDILEEPLAACLWRIHGLAVVDGIVYGNVAL